MADQKLLATKVLQMMLDDITKEKNKKIKFQLDGNFEKQINDWLAERCQRVYANIGTNNSKAIPVKKSISFSEFMNP